jgi:HPt (histidine-containing phosphotransfer) domain-containing protein
MTRLNEDIAAGRLSEAGAAAHRMKSSARSIGALKLGKLCEQVECMCNTGENTDNTELLNQFNEEIAAVEKYLATWTSNL